jgi:hypothetical protein
VLPSTVFVRSTSQKPQHDRSEAQNLHIDVTNAPTRSVRTTKPPYRRHKCHNTLGQKHKTSISTSQMPQHARSEAQNLHIDVTNATTRSARTRKPPYRRDKCPNTLGQKHKTSISLSEINSNPQVQCVWNRPQSLSRLIPLNGGKSALMDSFTRQD